MACRRSGRGCIDHEPGRQSGRAEAGGSAGSRQLEAEQLPTCAETAAGLVIVGATSAGTARAGATVKASMLEPVPWALVAVRLTVASPVWVGVPLIRPGSVESQAGREPVAV